ncbi:par-3 family cell polarity regulator beta a [Aplochiton taeniatus]
MIGQPSAGGASLGPTLGLMKSSSLESLQTAVQEARQNRSQSPVPFHRPRPNMARGRGINQSFRAAIDKSYDGPSEDDDLSEQSSGQDTPASSSSRQDLDADDGKKKKKKTKGKKKEKKRKGKKKAEESAEEQEKKTKKKGFGLLRFGKKDKGKAEVKAGKMKLDALSEEELERKTEERISHADGGYVTPDSHSLPDVEDDDYDPNYARIDAFRPDPSACHTPSPRPPAPQGGHSRQPSAEDLDGLYAKVNKQRPQAAQPQYQAQYQAQPQPQYQAQYQAESPFDGRPP